MIISWTLDVVLIFFSHLALPRSTSHLNNAELMMASCKLGLTFNSVNETLWCYHSNETSSAILSTWYYLFST